MSSDIITHEFMSTQALVWQMLLLWCLCQTLSTTSSLHQQQRGLVGSTQPLCLPACAHQPLLKPLIHADLLLTCPADAAAAAKTSCSSLTARPLAFPSRTGRNPGAVNPAKWHRTERDDKPVLVFLTANTQHLCCLNALNGAQSDLLFTC